MVETKEVNVVVGTQEIVIPVETEEIVIPIEAIGTQGEKGDKGDPGDVVDVKVNGVSVVNNGIANIDLTGKVDKVEGKGLSTNDYTNEEKTKLAGLSNYDDTEVKAKITNVESKIPTQATSSNQLADKKFVNSSIATNTSYYISNNGEPFNSVAELKAYSGTITNNDYAFVKGTDSEGNTIYSRYKYNSSNTSWNLEYVLNNSSFTAQQWASIQSGITSGKVSEFEKKYDKPSSGIPKSDLSNSLQESLNKADNSIQEHQDISGKFDKTSVKKSQTTSDTDTYSCNYVNGINTKLSVDYIIETGTNSNGTYIKYNSGRLICLGKISTIMGGSSTWEKLDNVYGKNITGTWNFPVAFTSIGSLVCGVDGSDTAVWIAGVVKTLTAITTIKVRYNNAPNYFGLKLEYIAIGKWK